MNKKLYIIDTLTFAFGLVLLLTAKGFGTLSADSGYDSLKWVFFAVLLLFGVITNLIYYRHTDETEISVGNFILPLILVVVFILVYLNPIVPFTAFPNAPAAPNGMIPIGIFCMLGAHFFFCLAVHLENVGILGQDGFFAGVRLFRERGISLRNMSPLLLILGGIFMLIFTVNH